MQGETPHLTHAHPWAHEFICCDTEHGASPSTPNQKSSLSSLHPSPAVQHPVSNAILDHTSSRTSHEDEVNMNEACPMEIYCCNDIYCEAECDGDCTSGLECCTDLTPQAECDACAHHEGVKEEMGDLEKWACTAEGCKAIQQYLECCTQADCGLPIIDPPPHSHHTVPQTIPMPLSQDYHSNVTVHIHPRHVPSDLASHSQQHIHDVSSHQHPFPFNTSSTTLPTHDHQQCHTSPDNILATTLAAHTCHWQNCHQVFASMPDLLAHVASDHLGAPGFPPITPIATAPVVCNQNQPVQLSTQSAEDQLLSCLWDDCFPVETHPEPAQSLPSSDIDMSGSKALSTQIGLETGVYPQHMSHQNTHEHTNSNGEPFSPQTILRHVLEEHLGIPGEIIGWDSVPISPIELAQPSNQIPQHHHHLHSPHSHSHPHSHTHLPSKSEDHSSPLINQVLKNQLANASSRLLGHPTRQKNDIKGNGSQNQLPTPEPSTNPPSPHCSHICQWANCHHDPFEDPASLMEHLTEVHVGRGKDSYICQFGECGQEGRKFSTRQKVLRHLQSHTGHRPYVCQICDQAFSEPAPLVAHMRRHAKEKPFRCEHPGCGKIFAIASSLIIHMRTHSGDKPCICPYCDKRFVEASNLTKHIRTHTGEKPFHCPHPSCGKRFARPDQMKRHMIVHDTNRKRVKI
ncbi:hypothetical protein TREMEDRAFT_72363 [Tremella mesenterica DSM 1558]|uniref:uncharacterized protein n=1 Tax=Tremella mesenterica (strain ATCC 24925 / CBS 8224 / DSM 1558 / NBRC 9311 / NRRL Y-6157 / RJB 2259-6 / UBC 559-6) TaxID=578456 RepID=UPI00032D4609|nr:uncharacterized protein TREMEDRAFT_72363 [Tremella mesenterica DSM 1558]EIW66520.1 hypothetical protein TREMEDRAFT_72363 [Tremella mesenterica DSM 1558]